MQKTGQQSATIVLIGNFNPSIFHPQWCAANDIISKTEADGAELKISSRQVTAFSTSWSDIQVTQNQFVISSNNPPLFDMMHDFVINTFDLLQHTPITTMGINLEQNIRSNSIKEHADFGDNLAAKDKWDFMKAPGLRDFVMEEQQRPDDYNGYIQVRIQALRTGMRDILISINDHYAINNHEMSMGCVDIMDILKSEWGNSIDRSKVLIDNVIQNFK